MRDFLQLGTASMQRLMGGEAPPVVEPEPGDNRFKDPDWSANPYFDFWKQSYLITTRWLEDLLERTEGLDERTRQRAEFYLKQVASALSPSNFPLTNPEVLRETFASSGNNLVQGMTNLVHDMEKSGDILSISQTDTEAFEVGRNIATSPGKVIFQNDILQLIQYAPSTDSVYRASAPDHSALDQQVLHPRPRSAEVLHPLCRQQRLHGVRRLLGEPRHRAWRTRLSKTT